MNHIGSCRKMVFLGGNPFPVTLNLFVLCTPPAPGS